LGIFTFSFEMGLDTADAASILLQRGAVVLINGSMQVGRRRLGFAHEVGHCVFADEYNVDWRISESAVSDAWESRIERFARALLLPSHGVTKMWNDGRERGDDARKCVVRIASAFRVDMSTLAKRLVELSLVDRSLADRIRKVRTTRSDIVEMNLVTHDELAAPSIPRGYAEGVLRLFRQEVISAERALDLLFDTWNEEDLPLLPDLPENSIWQFVS
jgi:Zn-dependent peptidase ImmA (M78 family)